jgi:hypothetical protein
MSDTVTLREHLAALREADLRFDAERDRRNTEVSQEREKALKIKEEEREKALSLAREIQTYKDEKANELRSQIERERGTYVTQSDLRGAVEKIDATMAPVIAYVASQQGGSKGMRDMYAWIIAAIAIVFAAANYFK